jgi:hypothetical protein
MCSKCDRDNETTLNVLRDCPEETQIWTMLVPSNQITNFFFLIAGTESLTTNFKEFIVRSGQLPFKWLVLLAYLDVEEQNYF